MLGARCWEGGGLVLGARCWEGGDWVLVAGCWVLGAGREGGLGGGCWSLGAAYWGTHPQANSGRAVQVRLYVRGANLLLSSTPLRYFSWIRVWCMYIYNVCT